MTRSAGLTRPTGRARLPGLAVTVFGLILLVLGLADAVLVGPDSTWTASATLRPTGSAVVITPGVVGTVGPLVTVDVRRLDGGPLFVGRATQRDVSDVVAGAPSLDLVGVRPLHRLRTATSGTAATLVPPSASDVWRAESTGTGTRELQWRPDDAESVLVAAPDGSALTPLRVTVSWHRASWFVIAVLLILVGLSALLAGLHMLTGSVINRTLTMIGNVPMPARRPKGAKGAKGGRRSAGSRRAPLPIRPVAPTEPGESTTSGESVESSGEPGEPIESGEPFAPVDPAGPIGSTGDILPTRRRRR